MLFASDSPYGSPPVAAVQTCAARARPAWSDEQVRGVAGGQLARIVAGEAPLDLGPPPGAPRALDPLLERIVSHLATVDRPGVRARDYTEVLGLARLACAVGEDAECAPVAAAVLELLDSSSATSTTRTRSRTGRSRRPAAS